MTEIMTMRMAVHSDNDNDSDDDRDNDNDSPDDSCTRVTHPPYHLQAGEKQAGIPCETGSFRGY